MKKLSNETKEIKAASRFTTKYSAERWVHISLGKAVAWIAIIVASSFLAGLGGSTYVRFNTALSLPGRVVAIEEELMSIQTQYMPLDLSMEKWKQNYENHAILEKKLDQIDSKIDNIRNLIK